MADSPSLTRVANMSSKTAVIFDMDGTLCDVTSIRHHVLDRRRRNYTAFHYLSVFCPPISWVRDRALKYHAENVTVLIVTARQEEWRHLTETWCDSNGIPYESVHMRRQGDQRKDEIIKSEILDHLLETYDIIHAFDDNPNVIELWRERGIEHTVVPGWNEEKYEQ